jgi:hypothetical protein
MEIIFSVYRGCLREDSCCATESGANCGGHFQVELVADWVSGVERHNLSSEPTPSSMYTKVAYYSDACGQSETESGKRGGPWNTIPSRMVKQG